MIFRGFTYALKPTGEQHQTMLEFAGVCRLVWNLCLDQRINHWRQYQRATGDNLNFVTQSRQLKDLRAEFDFIRAVSQTAQQRTMKDLQTAFERFFKGQGGFPKFKKAGTGDSFSFVGREVAIEKLNAKWSRIRLPKIGWVKFRDTRSVEGRIREATVTRTPLGWQISIGCLIDRDIQDVGGAVGIDRGVSVPLMLSDGTSYALPSSIDRLDTKHKRLQRIAARRKRGSNRHRKAIQRAAKVRAKQARIRKDWAHRATTEITRNHGTVVVERLRTKNMTKRARLNGVAQKRGLNRAILNVGWHQIETMLAYKAFDLQKVDPAYTSQTCSCCGTVDSRSRKNQEQFCCSACGHMENADLNAAKNIKRRGNIALLDVEVGQSIASCEASTTGSCGSEIPLL